MYLTAQRVQSLRTKKTGINAFLYRHGEEPVPGMSWDRPVIERVADEYIGTRGPEHVDIAPGGNRVLSFLDIVTADATPIPQIEEAVREFRVNFPIENLPASMTVGVVAIRFGAQYGLHELAREEFAAIAEQALDLLKCPAEPAWRSAEPLDVDVEHTEDGLRFTLRLDSKRRLAELHGPAWSAPRLGISHETREAFEMVHGSVYKNFVPILTDLDLERVAALGGMRFHDARTGAVLAEWPQR